MKKCKTLGKEIPEYERRHGVREGLALIGNEMEKGTAKEKEINDPRISTFSSYLKDGILWLK